MLLMLILKNRRNINQTLKNNFKVKFEIFVYFVSRE